MSIQDVDPVSRLAKLNKSDDYILWKRLVFAYIRRNDAELIGFEAEPSSNDPSVRKKWFELMIKAKSTLVLCLGDSPLAKVRGLVDDDDAMANVLWNELQKIYTASNAQSILNLRQEMDDLRYEEGKAGMNMSISSPNFSASFQLMTKNSPTKTRHPSYSDLCLSLSVASL